VKLAFVSISILAWSSLCDIGHCAEPENSVMVKAKASHKARHWSEYETRLLKHLKGFTPSPPALSKYGGRTDRKEEATGFFRTKKTDTAWVMLDPEGCHYLSIGLCSTAPNDTVADHHEAFASSFADRSDWAINTHALLVDRLRFNSLGCWSDWKTFQLAQREIPYVRRWNLMKSYARKKSADMLPVFGKGFANHCDEVCQQMADTRNDPWLIGHFSDNELPFSSSGILKRYLSCPADDPNHGAAADFLKAKGIKADAIARQHDVEFAEMVIRTYYETVHDAIRKHDPNHLILGSRLHGRASDQDICYTASGPFVDVVSINYYHRWTPEQEKLNRRARLAGKPILITEFYAKGADGGLNNSRGAGFTVPTQADRGKFYENFTLGLLSNPNVLGWHWFRYIDDGELKTKGHSSNKGIVDVQYREYRELGMSMSRINALAYPLSDFLRADVAATEQK
jgi:hypothetical protein